MSSAHPGMPPLFGERGLGVGDLTVGLRDWTGLALELLFARVAMSGEEEEGRHRSAGVVLRGLVQESVGNVVKSEVRGEGRDACGPVSAEAWMGVSPLSLPG